MVGMFLIYGFFFQAEDGIRDIGVTGVQTCALPIWYLAMFGFKKKRKKAEEEQPPRILTRILPLVDVEEYEDYFFDFMMANDDFHLPEEEIQEFFVAGGLLGEYRFIQDESSLKITDHHESVSGQQGAFDCPNSIDQASGAGEGKAQESRQNIEIMGLMQREKAAQAQKHRQMRTGFGRRRQSENLRSEERRVGKECR